MRIAVAGATGRVGRHVVDVLTEQGHDVVPMSRATGVDVISGEGLEQALVGVEAIVDTATSPSPDEQEATEFFTTSSRNQQELGQRAGVQRIIVVSIIGTDRVRGGYNAAKVEHEKAMLAGPVPVRILRAAQFHEFVPEVMEWGNRGEVTYVPKMRTQLIAARSVAEELAVLAVDPASAPGPLLEIAGPREEDFVEVASLLAARRGDATRVEGRSDLFGLDTELYEAGALLPGPDAKLAGPTFEEWLDASYPAAVS
jgi:uncharacterized protein YbjT (DUF2867 family)